MKALIVISLLLAGTINFISSNKEPVQDYMCSSYLESSNPTVYWPLCDSAKKVK